MNLLGKLRDTPALGGVVIVMLLGVAMYMAFGRSSGAGTPGGRWYYDMQTGERVAHDAKGEVPPLKLPNGHMAVIAHVFHCGGSCGSDLFIGYLEKFESHASSSAGGPIASAEKHLIAAAPEADNKITWIDANSASGVKLRSAPGKRCPDGVRECLPQ